MQLSVMNIEQYEAVITLWQSTEGIGLSSADSRGAIARYLERNPGLSLVAIEDGIVVGALLCGHDGRRGYIHHLAVKESHRRRQIGRKLVEHCLAQLRLQGIQKCHLFVYERNHEAIAFWSQLDFAERIELSMMSRIIDEGGDF